MSLDGIGSATDLYLRQTKTAGSGSVKSDGNKEAETGTQPAVTPTTTAPAGSTATTTTASDGGGNFDQGAGNDGQGNGAPSGNKNPGDGQPLSPEQLRTQFMTSFKTTSGQTTTLVEEEGDEDEPVTGGDQPGEGEPANGPEGPTVAFIEPEDEPGGFQHNDAVQDEIEGAGVDADNIKFIPIDVPAPRGNTYEEVLVNGVTHTYVSTAEAIENINNDPDNTIRTVNISAGNNNARLYYGFYADYVGINPNTGELDPNFANPELQAHIEETLGLEGDFTEQEFLEATVTYVDNLVTTNPDILAARERYENATAQAAANGTVIVVAAGNEQRDIDYLQQIGLDVDDGRALNFLAQNDNVIAVGAIDDNNTPDDFSDDTAADFSSEGGPGIGDIEIAADGVDREGDDMRDGTSFAAPQVAGAVARMLEANPDLTYEQVVQILQDTAYDNPNIDPSKEGAGTLQLENAVAAAKALAVEEPQLEDEPETGDPSMDEVPDTEVPETEEPELEDVPDTEGSEDVEDPGSGGVEDPEAGGGETIPGFPNPQDQFGDLFKEFEEIFGAPFPTLPGAPVGGTTETLPGGEPDTEEIPETSGDEPAGEEIPDGGESARPGNSDFRERFDDLFNQIFQSFLQIFPAAPTSVGTGTGSGSPATENLFQEFELLFPTAPANLDEENIFRLA